MNISNAMAEQNFLNELLRRLKRRKTLLVGMTMGLFAVVILGYLAWPKSYQATASVVVDSQTPIAAQNNNVNRDTPFDDQTIGTERAILLSHEILTDTIRQTGLLNNPEFNPDIQPPNFVIRAIHNARNTLVDYLPATAADIPVTPTDKALADTLQTLTDHHLGIKPIPHSRVIDITVDASNNALAAKIANTIARLYVDNHKLYKEATIQEAHEFLAKHIEELRADETNKAAAAEQYRVSHGLTAAMTATLVQEQVSGLSGQLQGARAKLADLEGQAATAAKSNPSQLPSVLSSKTISDLRASEASFAAERDKMAAGYGPDSPYLRNVNSQLAAVQSRIAAETSRAARSLQNDVASARANVASLSQQLATLTTQASQTEEARAKLATLDDDATTARTLYNDYNKRLQDTDTSLAYDAANVRILSIAAVPTRPAFPDPVTMLPAGFVVSMLLAGFTAYATTKPKGIIGFAEIERTLGDMALGMIPLRNSRTEKQFISSIAQLLNRLIYMRDRPKSIMITSAYPEEGKTYTARALADAAHQRGLSVVLIDADMHTGRVVKPKTSVNVMGLGDVLRGDIAFDDICRKEANGIMTLPAGTPRGTSTSLMALPSLGELMSKLEKEYQLVIVDAPPALLAGDCFSLARAVDKVIMLIKWQSTDQAAVHAALRNMGSPDNIAGVVLNMVVPRQMRAYGDAGDSAQFSKQFSKYYR
jgi:succinoglycan biosynthesis transport protein ExoP